MNYREYPAPAPLAAHVQCVWWLRDAAPPATPRTIFPDGRCELIVHLATPPECWDAMDGWHTQASTLFAAQRVAAVRLKAAGPLECIGVRLQPHYASGAWPGIANKFRDRIVDLEAIDASFSKSLAGAARRFSRGEPASLWKLLAQRVARHAIDTRVAEAVRSLELDGGRSRIEALARQAALSRRGFQIRFRAAVGLTPKEFARLTRLQATLQALDRSDSAIASVASDRGFSDQAHATRELRRVTGQTPARLRAALRRDREGDATVRMAAAFVRGAAG